MEKGTQYLKSLGKELLTILEEPKSNKELCIIKYGEANELTRNKINQSVRILLRYGLVNKKDKKYKTNKENVIKFFKKGDANELQKV